jgi:8-oxo-dGTP pyrophosphatase MutT (NUDIX family)
MMKRLFTIDLQDYDSSWPRSQRPTVRAIIEYNGKLAMIHKLKYDYYAFPGGGIEDGESYHDALIREVHEETGLRVIPNSIKDFGSALRLNSSHKYGNTIFEQENFYYRCGVEGVVDAQQLSEGEVEDQFTLEFVSAEDALHKNRYGDHGEETGGVWIERESRILEILIAGE